MPKRRHLDEPDKPIVDKDYKKSATRMGKIQHYINDWSNFSYTEPRTPEELRIANGGLAQATYLLPRSKQDSLFRRAGYYPSIKDYGLVKKAVGSRNLPVYQTAKDVIDRNNLIPIYNNTSHGDSSMGLDNRLIHAGNYPYTVYIDGRNPFNTYYKAWDLNDYGNSSTNNGKKLSTRIQNAGAKMLDAVGSPVVVTTGYQNYRFSNLPLRKNLEYTTDAKLTEASKKDNLLGPADKAFVEFLNNKNQYIQYIDGKPYIMHEPIEIKAHKRELKNGGSIYIKPSHRGRFTALKERTGHSATWFKENGTPAQKKMATFALNAAKWKH